MVFYTISQEEEGRCGSVRRNNPSLETARVFYVDKSLCSRYVGYGSMAYIQSTGELLKEKSAPFVLRERKGKSSD